MFISARENCALLGCYAAGSGNFLPTFRDNLSVTSSVLKNSWILKMGQISCPETKVRNYHSSLRNNPEEHSFIYFVGKPEVTLIRAFICDQHLCQRLALTMCISVCTYVYIYTYVCSICMCMFVYVHILPASMFSHKTREIPFCQR